MKSGDKYNRLTAIKKTFDRRWLFLCECGNYKEMLAYHVKSGASKSCGCLHKEIVTSHGLSGSKEHLAWLNMKARSKRPTDRQQTYAERGITYPDEWELFENFIKDIGMMPDYAAKWSLERIDNNLPYSKENCKWALPLDQAHNRCMPRTNTSGITGVDVRLEEDKYLVIRARVKFKGKEYSKRFPISRYSSKEEAIKLAKEWREEKLKELGFSCTHGQPLQSLDKTL